MGNSCNIHLPARARVDDIADVIGILAGLPTVNAELGSGRKLVRGVKVVTTTTPEMCEIEVRGDLVDNRKVHTVYCHFESRDGMKLLSPPSTPFWCAVACRLVEIFGGRVAYNGYYDRVDKFEYEPDAYDIHAETDEAYNKLQEALYSTKPLTWDDIAYMEKVSAYDLSRTTD